MNVSHINNTLIADANDTQEQMKLTVSIDNTVASDCFCNHIFLCVFTSYF